MRRATRNKFLLVFLDGVGLAPASADNPLALARMPTLASWLGGAMTSEQVERATPALLLAIDATLGEEGLPQSATGQTTLFTGINAAKEMGQHVPALPGPRLREILNRHSLFGQAARLGFRATFANAYTKRYLELLQSGGRRPSATSVAATAAGLRLRTEKDLRRGEAVTWDVTGENFSDLARVETERVAPREAGRRLARLTEQHDLTVFETFLSDLAGHRRFGLDSTEVLERFDGLFGGLQDELGPNSTVLVTSDHGNLEEGTHRSHTRNPVPLIAWGPAREAFAQVKSLVDVTPALLKALGGNERGRV